MWILATLSHWLLALMFSRRQFILLNILYIQCILVALKVSDFFSFGVTELSLSIKYINLFPFLFTKATHHVSTILTGF